MTTAEAPSPVICVVDDDPGSRGAVDSLLRSVGLATVLHGSLAEYRASSAATPTCLLLDVRLPGQSGLDFLIGMADAPTRIPVVLMTGYGDMPLAVRAMKAGAVDVLSKPFTDLQLLSAVEAAIEAERSTRAYRTGVERVQSQYLTLTPRERQVMTHVTAGLMNKQIAWELSLSEVTVKIHRSSVMRKMAAKSLPELVRMASLLGSALPPDPQPAGLN